MFLDVWLNLVSWEPFMKSPEIYLKTSNCSAVMLGKLSFSHPKKKLFIFRRNNSHTIITFNYKLSEKVRKPRNNPFLVKSRTYDKNVKGLKHPPTQAFIPKGTKGTFNVIISTHWMLWRTNCFIISWWNPTHSMHVIENQGEMFMSDRRFAFKDSGVNNMAEPSRDCCS